MEAKEKAKELVNSFIQKIQIELIVDRSRSIETITLTTDEAKQCALICVDEILILIKPLMFTSEKMEYWQEVKKEIEAL